MSKVDEAVAYFHNSCSCSQAILAAYGEQFGISTEQALQIAGAFGAGMGRMSLTCGAVTGSFMVLGLHVGTTKHDLAQDKETTYKTVQTSLPMWTA